MQNETIEVVMPPYPVAKLSLPRKHEIKKAKDGSFWGGWQPLPQAFL
jgi:hypothetical protein